MQYKMMKIGSVKMNKQQIGKQSIHKKRKLCFIAFAIAFLLLGCSSESKKYGLDPKHPTTIQIWHYYNSAQKNAFDELTQEFNETIGAKQGIIVEGHSLGDVNNLEESVMSAINKEVGSEELPNIFASYADTAFKIEQLDLLADLEPYFSEKEQEKYLESFIEEGRIGEEMELKIFPTAKSSEIFMLSKTDWDLFSEATNTNLSELETKEGLATVAEKYYNWTDSLTPDIPDDGKAFYGRDAMANLFIVGAKQLGNEIFHVENQKMTLNIAKETMHRIWDIYYLPYIKGYYVSYGKFRSDDVKIGKIISYVGSTSSAVYFPKEVTLDDTTYPIEAIVLPVPKFADGENYAVQQGAGMVVLKGEKKEEYASVLFLKWFTEKERNIKFSCLSGYMPVQKSALNYESFQMVAKENELSVDPITDETLHVAFEMIQNTKLYTNKAFLGGVDARKVLEYHLQEKADADLEIIQTKMAEGMTRMEAVSLFDTEENFEIWYSDFRKALEEAIPNE